MVFLVYLPLSASNQVQLEFEIREFVTDVVVVDGVVADVEDVGLVVVENVKLVKYSLSEVSSTSNLTIWEAINSFS